MARQVVIRAYKRVKDAENINATEMAGKYFVEYPADALSKITQDILDYRVPRVIGEQAKLIIQSVITSESRGDSCFM